MSGSYGFPEGVTTLNIEEYKDILKVSLSELIYSYIQYKDMGNLGDFDPKSVVKPILSVGPPGVGKSQVVFQIAHEINNANELGITDKDILDLHDIVSSYGEKINVIDLRLSQLDPTDIKGLPKFAEDDTVIWVLPKFLPRGGLGEEFGILFLDEINLAPPSVQAACYQLILDRKVGDYELPKGWIVVAAMNPPEMAHIAHPLPPPLVNRFTIVYVEPNVEVWLKWAITVGIDPDIIAYITRNPGSLFEFDPRGEPFPSPRTWEYVDVYLKREEDYTEDELEALITGSVGKKEGRKFLIYRKIRRGVPIDDLVEDVINGKQVDPLEQIPENVNIEGTEFRRIDMLTMIVVTAIESIGRYDKLPAPQIAKNVLMYLKYLEDISKQYPQDVPRDMVVTWKFLLNEVVNKVRGKR